MTNRNNPCPCGSGRKYKKCCIQASTAGTTAKSSIPKHLSFAALILTEFAEDLPFLPLPIHGKKKNLVHPVLNYLEENTPVSFDINICASDKIRIGINFQNAFGFSDDYNYDYDEDWEDDTLEVCFSEMTTGGVLEIEVFRNKMPDEISRNTMQVNAALMFLWMGTAKAVDRTKLPEILKDLHKFFIDIPQKKKILAKQREQLSTELKTISLVSISLSLEPILANLKNLSQIDPQISLPDKLPIGPLTFFKFSESKYQFGQRLQSLSKQYNLPDVFLSPSAPPQKTSEWNNNSLSQQLIKTIHYHFSDGAVINAGQILTTKYALLLPPDLLPGKVILNEGDSLWDQKFSNSQDHTEVLSEIDLVPKAQGFHFYGDTAAITNKIITELIVRLSSRLNRDEIKVDLNWINNTSKSCLRLSKINLAGPLPLQWESSFESKPLGRNLDSAVITGTLSLKKVEGTNGQIIALKDGYLSLESRILWLQNLSRDLQNWDYLKYGIRSESNFNFNESIRCEISTWPELKATLCAENVQAFEALKKVLQANTKYFPEAPATGKMANAMTIKMANPAKSELHLDSSGRFSLIRHLQTTNAAHEYPFLNGLSHTTLKLLKIFSVGIPGYFGHTSTELATKSREKRDFELKLLKHLGVLNLLIFESLSFRFQGVLSDGTIVKKTTDILALLEPKILALLGESQNDLLQKRCSQQLYNKLKTFMTDLSDSIQGDTETTDLRNRLLLVDGEYVLPNLLEDELRMIFAVLNHAALASNGEIFAKARFNFFSKIFPFDESRLGDFQIFNSKSRIPLEDHLANNVTLQLPYVADNKSGLLAMLSAFRPLLNVNFEFYIKGQLISELQDSEFQTEMTLAENRSADQASVGPIDWFELNPKFFLHGQEIPSQQATQLLKDGIIEYNGRFYLIPASRLPSLKRLSSFWERLQAGKKYGPNSSVSQQVFQVPKSQILEMLALRSSGIPVIGGTRWQQICNFYDRLDTDKEPLNLPRTIHADLKRYQKVGVQWLYELYRLGLGAVLADDMGLGKTLQTLAFLEKLRSENCMGSVLIVVPTSLTYNWLSEIEKFVPGLLIQIFSAKTKDGTLNFMGAHSQSIVLTTYGLMHEHKEFFQQINWNIIIFDEAQNLKTITTQRTTTARSLKSHIKICLTGTPLENHLGEFYSILDLAVPGCVGPVDEFRKTYVIPPSVLADDLRFLKLKSRPLVLRRTKQQILSELPEKTESRVSVDFENKQKKIYRDIALSYNEKIQQTIASEGENKCQIQMLTALLRLRQACSDPSALPGVTYKQTPPKLEALKDALVEIVECGQSALVFTQFLRTLERTEALLKSANLPAFTIHGGLSQSQRQKVLREFNDCPGGAVLVMTLKTGGVGLNLAKASYVFHLEPWWNPAVENQATDRAHRMGQRRAVQVYRYIMHESVEEKIEVLKARKQVTFSSIFGDHENIDSNSKVADRIDSAGSFLSKEDFNFLLSVNDERYQRGELRS